MKKRFFALAICFLMILPLVLTGCANQENNESTERTNSIRENVSLNMYIITDEKTDADQAKAVQMSINEITLPQYKTTVKINYITADKYWQAVEDMENQVIAKALNSVNSSDTQTSSSADTGDEEMSDEEIKQIENEFNNLIDMVYDSDDITLSGPALDIILIDSPEKYMELANAGKLYALDTTLSGQDKLLNSYIYPVFLKAAKLSGSVTYGIPVNKPIGKYEYFVFNKSLLAKYGFKVSDFNTFEDLERYLSVIKANEPSVVPLTKAPSPANFDFYGPEGSAVAAKRTDNMTSFAENIFNAYENNEFKNHFSTVRKYKLAGYIPDSYTQGQKFAVDVRTGYDYSPEVWETEDKTSYECVVYKKPVANNENVLNSVFAVSAFSSNPTRAAEIIKYFNTNSDLANLLQYGIRGTHYFLNDTTKEISFMDDHEKYIMNNEYTGNTYIKYNVYGSGDHLESYKKQNLNIGIGSFLGFNAGFSADEQEIFDAAQKITQKYYDKLLQGTLDVDSTFNMINNELSNIAFNSNGTASRVSFDDFIKNVISERYVSYISTANETYYAQ